MVPRITKQREHVLGISCIRQLRQWSPIRLVREQQANYLVRLVST